MVCSTERPLRRAAAPDLGGGVRGVGGVRMRTGEFAHKGGLPVPSHVLPGVTADATGLATIDGYQFRPAALRCLVQLAVGL